MRNEDRKTSKKTGYQLIFEALKGWGIRLYCGVTGGGVIHFLKHIRPYDARNPTQAGFMTLGEYSAGFVPLGYFLKRGEIAAAVATTGAATKLLTCGMSDAKLHDIPAVYIVPLSGPNTQGLSPLQDTSVAMLDDAVDTPREHERPVIHSDRGSHYRWPGWLDRINASGLIRSMSRKGCPSDNAACEGFFGRVKNEMYYGRNWAGTTLEDFMYFLDRYIRCYNESRIKISLGAMSPVRYRRHLGIRT